VFRPTGRVLFGRLLPRGLPLPIVLGPLRGLRLILGGQAGEGGGGSAYFGMIEPEQTRRLAETLQSGETFIDLGANIGYYTMLASRLVGPFGKVISVEPLLDNLILLKRHMKLNGLTNITIAAIAVCEDARLATFSVGINNATGTLSKYAQGTATLLVPTATLDQLVEALAIRPHVVKIDVEGAEMAVLEGAQETLNRFRPAIFLSTHSDKLTADCIARLTALSYDLEPLNGTLGNASEYLAKPRLRVI
jgi:FkbM family methyltransferase